MDSASVSEWIDGIKQGDRAAQTELWRRYYALLIDEARQFLAKRHRPRPLADEEDILQSVFESVFRRAERGDYPDLCNRKELWRLLITVTERKVINQVKFETRLVRGGYRKQFSLPESRSRSNALMVALGPQAPTPSPETVTELVLTIEEFFGNLDAELQRVAQLKLEGHSVAEIADSIGRSRRTVDRLLRLLRAHLKKMTDEG